MEISSIFFCWTEKCTDSHNVFKCLFLCLHLWTNLHSHVFWYILTYLAKYTESPNLWLKCGLWQCWDLRTLKDFAWFHEQLVLNLYHLPWFHCLLRSISSAHNSKAFEISPGTRSWRNGESGSGMQQLLKQKSELNIRYKHLLVEGLGHLLGLLISMVKVGQGCISFWNSNQSPTLDMCSRRNQGLSRNWLEIND